MREVGLFCCFLFVERFWNIHSSRMEEIQFYCSFSKIMLFFFIRKVICQLLSVKHGNLDHNFYIWYNNKTFKKQNKILMRNKKPRTRITRHKVPNLLNPQQRFDQPTHTASFFTKIENSFKMLQGPARNKSNMSHYSSCGPNDSHSFHHISKNNEKNSMEAPEQSKRVVRHHSSLGGQEMQTKQIIPIKKTVKSRLINPKLPQLSNQKSASGVSEINGTKLAPMPLENILRYREKLLDEALPNENLLVETISEDSETARTISEQENFRPAEKNAHPNVWVEMIINGQGKIYDNYDRMIMEKVKGYVRKKYKINHKSMWK